MLAASLFKGSSTLGSCGTGARSWSLPRCTQLRRDAVQAFVDQQTFVADTGQQVGCAGGTTFKASVKSSTYKPVTLDRVLLFVHTAMSAFVRIQLTRGPGGNLSSGAVKCY